MAIVSEILRFILPASKTKSFEFLKLRQHIANSHGIQDQYFGYVFPVQGAGLPARENEMCWVVQWPQTRTSAATSDLRSRLHDILASTTTEPNPERSLQFSFSSAQIASLSKALTAPVCEFAIINLLLSAPKSDVSFTASLHKTFTDCYLAGGFKGGAWGYASNTNDSDGAVLETSGAGADGRGGDDKAEVPEEERRLACYYLGWESIEHHHQYSRSAIFAEEIDKLAPYFGPGTGAWYVKFEKHGE